MIAGHAALLAWKSGRPVKLVYDRAEDMMATTKRHPSRTRHRTAVTRDGRLLAREIDFAIDGGAYCTLSPVVLSRGTIHAAGPYFCPYVRVRARAVATNVPPHGAFRGFGAPQSIFALERHMDRVAAAVRLSPDELRRRNFIKTGETSAVGQVIRDRIDLGSLLTRALELTDFRRKREQFAAANAGSSTRKQGVGLAAFMHGAGFTGSGEDHLASIVTVEATREGRVRVLTASTEIGQGTNTIFSQIAAEALGTDIDSIEIAQPDTALVPNSGPTVASRTCMVVGKILEDCAQEMRSRLEGLSPAEYYARHGSLTVERQYEPPAWVHWDEERYRGDAYATFGWGCDVVELEVDRDTFEVRPIRVTAVQEFGRPIHPALAQGQIEGGTVQGLGYALLEQVVMQNGSMANAQLTNYTIPTTLDTPALDIVMLENPYPGGPFGAKGVGELPMDGPAPAVVNALRHLGFDVREIPATPELLASPATAERRAAS